MHDVRPVLGFLVRELSVNGPLYLAGLLEELR